MSFLDAFDLPFIKKKVGARSKREPKEYVSKLTGKNRSRQYERKSNERPQTKGGIKKFVGRYVNVVLSDINVLCSIWKPRVVIVRDYDVEDLYE